MFFRKSVKANNLDYFYWLKKIFGLQASVNLNKV